MILHAKATYTWQLSANAAFLARNLYRSLISGRPVRHAHSVSGKKAQRTTKKKKRTKNQKQTQYFYVVNQLTLTLLQPTNTGAAIADCCCCLCLLFFLFTRRDCVFVYTLPSGYAGECFAISSTQTYANNSADANGQTCAYVCVCVCVKFYYNKCRYARVCVCLYKFMFAFVFVFNFENTFVGFNSCNIVDPTNLIYANVCKSLHFRFRPAVTRSSASVTRSFCALQIPFNITASFYMHTHTHKYLCAHFKLPWHYGNFI